MAKWKHHYEIKGTVNPNPDSSSESYCNFEVSWSWPYHRLIKALTNLANPVGNILKALHFIYLQSSPLAQMPYCFLTSWVTLYDDCICLSRLQGYISSLTYVYPYQVFYLYPAEPRKPLSVSFSLTEAEAEFH
jgi:hypothetical protein